ncbi:4-hydroxy-tetrahydrodipicolinate synthase [Mucilaginibacter sp. PPCGB 2223]|uniref:4-hydroxy-tetrahydrodipicolinate synthase n=1 Tax=Mucilaginibacter sp. PPCGB 2223 TaxID=1886027 RepID=UPI0008262077|nr:4-hydroxy-tetrahydrodipicolinate synthase [Mucilaginibacter sp. PPCGB 2223]OCX51474.1 4-hydroxy-tetrahydrodipicolinate synthase [Mucilaginibacter sp. PPCGB 2223]
MSTFNGTGVAVITPFHPNGEVDFGGLEAVINHIIGGGVEYVVSLGTTGESATLNKDEKKQVWKRTVEFNNGRVPLVAGIGGNNTYEVLRAIEEFDTTGYSAILSVSPYYSKPTQEGIYQHYKAIAEKSPLPVILYNVPSRTGSTISAETTLRLAHDFKNIIATKEASGSFDIFNQIMRDKPADFKLISGDDPVTLPMMAMGCSGVISVIANAVPKVMSDMVRLCLKGDFATAQPLHYSTIEFTRLMFAEGNPGGVKEALKQLGVCGNTVRLPLVGVSRSTADQIGIQLKQLA